MQRAVLAPFTKNLRYIAVLEGPLRVLVVTFVCARLSAPPRRIAQAVVVLALCFADVSTYQRLCVRDELYDPVTQKLLRYRFFRPSPSEESAPTSTDPSNDNA